MAHRPKSSSSSESDCRIVLLGKAGAGKSKVTRTVLGEKKAVGESGLCVIHRGNVSERNVCLVEAPGWDRISIQRTSEKIKHEIIRSVTLCSPGPHAVILVLPVSLGNLPSANELKAAVRHTELLSERVWNHTVVLFLCDQDVDQAAINQHLEVSGKLLEKCGGRHYVLKGEDSETQRQEFFKEIDDLVEENCGDCFLPQVYYELMQSQMPKDTIDLIKMYENRDKQLKEAHQRTVQHYKTQLIQEKEAYEKTLDQYETQVEELEKKLKQRRGSMALPPPHMSGDQVQPDVKDDPRIQDASYYFKPAAVVVVAIIGAQVGSVVGSEFGVLGSCLGISIGALVTLPVALKVIDAVMPVREVSPPPKKEDTSTKDAS